MERFSSPEAVVSLRRADFRYPDGTHALDGVDLEIPPGEIVVVLGPNGAGKSTLLRLVAAALPGAADADRAVGAVFDTPAFQDALTVRDNLVWYLRLRGETGERSRTTADRWLGLFGLGEWADRPVGTCSFGTRRRLALAEAFGSAAPLFVLDEPLSGLDPRARRLFARALAEARSTGSAALIAVHDPDFARDVADRVLFLEGGRIVGEGAPEALVAGLGIPLRFEVAVGHRDAGMWSLRGDPADRSERGPAGPLELDFSTLPTGLAAGPHRADHLTLAAPGGPATLPAALEWVAGQGLSIRGVRVREPGLADVFFHLTGRTLRDVRAPDALSVAP